VEPTGLLANGLLLLGTSQPPARIRRFWHPALNARLTRELAASAHADDRTLGDVVRLLGTVQLIGGPVNRRYLDGVPAGRLQGLPSDVLDHPPDAVRVEQYQLQLWLGLRALASLRFGSIRVGEKVLRRTLTLWRTNLEEAMAVEQGSARHRLSASMMAWLASCLERGGGTLLPSSEPLWTLMGFPREPRAATPATSLRRSP
jgi:hypothetical protein